MLSRVRFFATPWTIAHQAPLSLGFSRQVDCHALLQGIFSIQGIKPRSPALQADSLPPEPPGKPMNTGVVSLSLLQGIFPTQESNQGLVHCRQIPYQLSYQWKPNLWQIIHRIKMHWLNLPATFCMALGNRCTALHLSHSDVQWHLQHPHVDSKGWYAYYKKHLEKYFSLETRGQII